MTRIYDVERRSVLTGIGAVGISAASAAAANGQTADPGEGRLASPQRFAGKAVLITGATSGIGRKTAEAFAGAGALVLFNGRREELGRQVEAEIRASGGMATYLRGDVREPAQMENFIAEGARKFGRVDVLFNNAGIFMTPAEIQDATFENYQDIMATNAGGVFLGMKYVIPVMRRQGSGAIINMASVAAHKGFPNTPAYNASKHAIIGLTKSAAIANAKHGIRINSISPLAVDTPQLRESFAYQKIDAEAAAASFVTPRILTAEEIARAVMFLASDDASSVTGMNLDVTAGQLA
jgi:NAD(P)-dependent dehydrogenase (short-subunit alcohol dehydrogenase family)